MYDNKHKVFLHHMLKNGFLSVGKALHFCKNIKAENVKDVDTLKDFTSEINREISKQEFKILLSICELTGEQQVVLINTANDDITKLQNIFSSVELELFQTLLQEIVTSDEKKIKQIVCLNLSSTLTENLSRSDAEKLIDKWVRMGYLLIHNNEVHLGARCIIEFTSFFRAHCKDYIRTCNLCSELVFTGRTCSSCKKIMHSHCLEKFLEKKKKCPECKNSWEDDNDDDNSASESQQEDNTTIDTDESFGPTQSKRRR